MKRILLLACFGLFIITGLFGQEIDFKYKVDSLDVNNYNITISISKGNGPFFFELYDNTPTYGGKLLTNSGLINSKSFTFSHLDLKRYFIYVYSSNRDLGRGKRIQIKSKNQ